MSVDSRCRDSDGKIGVDCDMLLDVIIKARYRRAIASTRWHFCTNCSQWPAVAYEEVKNPEHPPTDGLCQECVEKRKRKHCRWWEESVSNRRLIPKVPR
jgi:hypothetical protein